MLAVDDAGGDALGILGQVPESLAGDVACAFDLYGEGAAAVTAHADGDACFLSVEGAGVNEGGEAVAGPELFACLGLKGAEPPWVAHD